MDTDNVGDIHDTASQKTEALPSVQQPEEVAEAPTTELPTAGFVPAKPKFTEKENRRIDMWAEAARRSRVDVPANPSKSQFADMWAEAILRSEEGVLHEAVTNREAEEEPLEGNYAPTRRHAMSFVMASWKQLGGGLLALFVVWTGALLLPGLFQNAESSSGSSPNWIVILVTAGLTIIVLGVTFLIVIDDFKHWTNFTLEVDNFEVKINQIESFIGRVDSLDPAIRRRSVETVIVQRKWYLFFLNAYTVTFNAAGTSDDLYFHDMKFIKNGKLLKKLFSNRTD